MCAASAAILLSQSSSKNIPVITGNAKVDRLLSQMTLAEKISLIHGSPEDIATSQGQPGYVAGVPRLNIPSLRLVDGPPGVLTKVWSTGMTSTMGLAATFDRELARKNSRRRPAPVPTGRGRRCETSTITHAVSWIAPVP